MPPLETDDLREAFLARLSEDTGFQEATGADNGDERLYQRYNGDAVITNDQPAYVTYMLLPHGETRDGLNIPVFSLIIWSQDQFYDAVKAVKVRLRALFDKKRWNIGSGDDAVEVYSRIVREMDTDEPSQGIMGRIVQVRVASTQFEDGL